jgi:nitronate monooxygenase
VSRFYRRLLRETPAEATIVTDAVTGRPARWIRSRIVDALASSGVGTLGWPAQGALLRDIRRAGVEQDRPELAVVLAGEASSLVGADAPAQTIVAELVDQSQRALRRLGAAC